MYDLKFVRDKWESTNGEKLGIPNESRCNSFLDTGF